MGTQFCAHINHFHLLQQVLVAGAGASGPTFHHPTCHGQEDLCSQVHPWLPLCPRLSLASPACLPPAAKATQYNGHLPCWAQPSLLHPLTLATSGANLQAGLVRRFTPPPVHHSHPSPCSDAGQKDAIHQPTHTAICSTPLVLSTLQTHICMSTQTYIQ